MQARVMNGYWCFAPIAGYRYERISGHGKILVRDEPVASVIQEALESFVSGRFETQCEIKRFLENSPSFSKDRKGPVHYQFIQRLLTQSLYAGYIDVSQWGISFQPGKHEPLIRFETWQAIQNRLKGQAKAPARKDIHDDFPLRGFVTCGHCRKPMTACWSTGSKRKYPYYFCHTKGCSESRKSIRKERIEEEFEQLLSDLRPSQNLFFLAREMFQDLWKEKEQRSGVETKSLKTAQNRIENKVEQLMNRIVEVDDPSLIMAYENQIRKLQEERTALSEKVKNCGRSIKTFDETFRTAFDFLSNPCKLWDSDRLEDKRSVLKLVFAKRLPYDRNEGFRTAAISLPFSLLEGLKGGQYDLARAARVERGIVNALDIRP